MSSLGRMTVWPVRPWRRAFREERRLPSGVTGPVEWAAFSRLTVARADGFIGISFLAPVSHEGCGRGTEWKWDVIEWKGETVSRSGVNIIGRRWTPINADANLIGWE